MQDGSSSRSRHKTLRVQADVPHTFGPLLIPLAVLLVSFGGFELERCITHPLESDAASILFYSVVLACGLILAAVLLRPIRISSTFRTPVEAPVAINRRPLLRRTAHRAKILAKVTPPPRPFHRFYVDETRVSR